MIVDHANCDCTPRRIGSSILIGVALLLGSTMISQAEPTSEEMNAANNPLQPTYGLKLQNYYTASYYGLDDADGNALTRR